MVDSRFVPMAVTIDILEEPIECIKQTREMASAGFSRLPCRSIFCASSAAPPYASACAQLASIEGPPPA